MRKDDPNVGRNPIAGAHLDQVADHHLVGPDGVLNAVPDDARVLGHHPLEAVHDPRRLPLLEVGEAAGDEHDDGEHKAQVEVVWEDVLDGGQLDCVGHEAEDGSDPEEQREAAEELRQELAPLALRFRRGQRVRPVGVERLGHLFRAEAELRVGLVAGAELLQADHVVVDVHLLLQLLYVDLLAAPGGGRPLGACRPELGISDHLFLVVVVGRLGELVLGALEGGRQGR